MAAAEDVLLHQYQAEMRRLDQVRYESGERSGRLTLLKTILSNKRDILPDRKAQQEEEQEQQTNKSEIETN